MYSKRADNLEKVIAVESWAIYGQALHKLCLVRAVQGRIQTVQALPMFQADQALRILVAEVVLINMFSESRVFISACNMDAY